MPASAKFFAKAEQEASDVAGRPAHHRRLRQQFPGVFRTLSDGLVQPLLLDRHIAERLCSQRRKSGGILGLLQEFTAQPHNHRAEHVRVGKQTGHDSKGRLRVRR